MEEKKQYPIIGKVVIGTDEYRDLIEAVAEAKKDSDRYMHQYWDEQTKRKNAEEREKTAIEQKLAIEKKLEGVVKFITSDPEVQAKYNNAFVANILFGEDNK